MSPQEQPYISATPAEPKPLSEIARLSMIFSSPSEAFRDIAARPRWWPPIVLVGIVQTAYALAFGAKIGWERGMRQVLESSGQAANMTPQQLEVAVSRAAQFTQIASYFGIISTLVIIALMAVVLKFLFDMLMGADLGLKRMMAIVSYSYLPMILFTLLVFLVMNLKNPDDFSLTNPLAFNVGSFLPDGTSAWLRSVGSSLDLFSFWVMGLIALGISVAARRISFGKALVGVMVPWALYVCLRAGALALQSARS